MFPRSLALATLLLAGCSKDGALDIVVPATPGVVSVRLYVGVGDGRNSSIAPQGFADYASPTRWWPLDPAAALDVRDVSDGSDAVFELARGADGLAIVNAAIVVGFDAAGNAVGAGELRSLDIPADYIARHTLPLDPQLRVTTWPAGKDTCVAVENAALGRTDMVVTPTDPDCDSYLDGTPDECDPFFFEAKGSVRLDDVSCVTQATATSNGTMVPACVLGGPTCIDGTGTLGVSCAESRYCVPKNACAACSSSLDCLYGASPMSGVMSSQIQCDIGLDENGLLCTHDYPVDIDANWPTAAPPCTGEVLITRGGGYGNEVTFPVSNGAVKLQASGLDAGCAFLVRVEGLLPPTESVSAFVAGDFDNGRGFGIPIRVSVDPLADCVTTFGACTYVFDSSDAMLPCVTSPP